MTPDQAAQAERETPDQAAREQPPAPKATACDGLLCVRCHATPDIPGYVTTCPRCGGLLDAVYDLRRATAGPAGLDPISRFAGLLPAAPASFPAAHGIVSTPLIELPAGAAVPVTTYAKWEGAHPTGSAKDPMAVVALAYMRERGVRAFAFSSTGNTTAAFARALRLWPGPGSVTAAGVDGRDGADRYEGAAGHGGADRYGAAGHGAAGHGAAGHSGADRYGGAAGHGAAGHGGADRYGGHNGRGGPNGQAGLTGHVLVPAGFPAPADPPPNLIVHEVAGDYAEAHHAVATMCSGGMVAEGGFFSVGRREGLKLAYLEALLAAPRPPTVIVQAISSGMGIVAAAKAAAELAGMGLLARVPRLVAVQQESCAPMAASFRAGAPALRAADVIRYPKGQAVAILLGDPSASYPYVRDAVLGSGGTLIAAPEADICAAFQVLRRCGLDACFSSATALAALPGLWRSGWLTEDDVVLVNLTGSARSAAGQEEVARQAGR